MWRKTGAIGDTVFWSSPTHKFSAVKHPSTTIRMPSKIISGPFWPAESNRNIHLSIALLVVARLARTSPNSEGKKFRPKFLHHLVKHQQPAIRKAWRVGFRPIWCAESACGLRLSIGPLVLVPQAKNIKLRDTKIAPKLCWVFTPCTPSTTYSQNSVGGWSWTSLRRWIRLRSPFIHSSSGCWETTRNIQEWKIPADIFIRQ